MFFVQIPLRMFAKVSRGALSNYQKIINWPDHNDWSRYRNRPNAWVPSGSHEKALSDGVELGPCMVFFGCRSETNFLHSERMRSWVKTGVITDLQVAFSRLPGHPKEYVQHLVKKRSCEVWAMLSDPSCHYYICGDSQMAEDVFDELKATARNTGGFDHIGGVDFFRKMKKEHRFQTDTWGVVAKRDVALKKLVEKKHNQAGKWLKNFDEEKKEDAV